MPGVTYNPTYRSGPAWAQDGIGGDTLLMGGGRLEAAQFPRLDAVTVTASANAAQNATSISVDALSGPIPAGTILHFGGAKLAVLSAAAATGATSIAVNAIPTAIVDNDVATYAGVGLRQVVAGTPIGRTFAERDAGTGFGPAATTDDEFYLLALDVIDADRMPECELYRHQRAVRENVLPNWANLTTQMKAKIRELYQCFTAV